LLVADGTPFHPPRLITMAKGESAFSDRGRNGAPQILLGVFLAIKRADQGGQMLRS